MKPLDMYATNFLVSTHELVTPDKLKAAREERQKLIDAMHGLTDEQRNDEFHVGWLREQAEWFRKDGKRLLDDADNIVYRNRVLGIAQGYQQAADDIEQRSKRRAIYLRNLSEVLDL